MFQEEIEALDEYDFCSVQGRIQDFKLGGRT